MKPVTKIQKKLYEYCKALPQINDKHIAYGKSKVRSFALTHYNKVICSDCNHNFLPKGIGIPNKSIKCPNCNAKLEPKYKILRGDYCDDIYFTILSIYKGYQVVRDVLVRKYLSKTALPDISVTEVRQSWIDNDGNVVNFALSKAHNFSGVWNWVFFTPNIQSEDEDDRWGLKYRDNFGISTNYIENNYFYPGAKLIKNVRRNGFSTRVLLEIDTPNLIVSLLKDYKAETLMKAKQYQLLYKVMYSNSIDWRLIKIALRHKYIVNRPNDWFDYIRDLERLNIDTSNPKYLLPENLQDTHREISIKIRILDEKIRLQYEIDRGIREVKELEETELAKQNYPIEKQKYFGILIKKKNIEISPIKTIKRFEECGEELNHCVYTSRYYARKDSLVLEVLVKGKLTETIEYSLTENKLLQSRGLNNEDSKYHDLIINTFNTNIKKAFRENEQTIRSTKQA